MAKRTSRQRKQAHTGFFAYPSEPKHRGDTIERAVRGVNDQCRELKLATWTQMARSSSRIITNILESIRQAEFFIADISDLNPNVLFEAGYAFGKAKRTLLFTQGFSSTERSQDLKDLDILAGWDIGSYHNADGLATNIIARNPFRHSTSPEIEKYQVTVEQSVVPGRGLFLKGDCGHDMAIHALKTFRECFPQTHVDDWMENGSQSLLWYLREVVAASGIVALFIPHEWDNSRHANARFAFVCGMAVALGKNVRMIGFPGFSTPFDYQDIMVQPKNVDQVERAVTEAFPPAPQPIRTESMLVPEGVDDAQRGQAWAQDAKEVILLEINLGDNIAENEEDTLAHYFVVTGQFTQALKAKQAVLVGNKGSGKTATFFQLRDALQKDVRNLVVEIKPADYKMGRFLQSLSTLWEREGFVGHILESVWKLIIYCEIMKGIQAKIEARSTAAGASATEQRLIAFAHAHTALVDASFELKLDIASRWLEEVSYNGDNFSRKIHSEFLTEAKTVLQPFINRFNRVVILIDNLDKSWIVESDLTLQAQLFLSLMGIHRRLSSDFGGDCPLSLVVFVRRNIFEFILGLDTVREPDKLIADSIELVWHDAEMLMRVISDRFRRAVQGTNHGPGDPMDEFFCPTVDGIPTKEWIYKNVLPRPRDLIHFVQKAIEWAINRGHADIQEADLKKALASYSGFAIEQIIAEYKAEQPWLPDVIWSFMGEQSRWTYEQLETHLEAQLSTGTLPNTGKNGRGLLANLVGIGFFGVQFPGSEVEYVTSVQKSRSLTARVRSDAQHRSVLFAVHPVFHQHLSIRPKNATPLQAPTDNEQMPADEPPNNDGDSAVVVKQKFLGQLLSRILASITNKTN